MPYLMTDAKKPEEYYTYGSRISWQLKIIVELLRKTPNTNQAVLQVAQPEDIHLGDPPCLRHIHLKVVESRLHIFPYFRSWDLWGGFPANLAGIAVLHKYLADEIGIKQGNNCL